MLSGGLGGLGLRACALLSGMGASRLLLSSRSGHVARKRSDSEILDQQLIDLCSSKAEIAAHACDVADAQDAHRLGSHTTQCLGYFHAASSSGNALMNSPRVLPLFQAHLTGPKALGAYHLASCTQQQCFHTVLLFSSLAALGLSVAYQGTSLYASANAYLDSFAQTSRASARPSLSLRMANVGGQGMGSVIPDEFASLPGLVRISLDEFDRSIAQAVLWVCQPFATFNVLPSASYKLVHEFEGWATVMVDDEVEAMRVLEGPVQLKRSSSVCSRLSAAHAALVALDAVAAGTSLRLHTVNDVVIVGGGMTGLIVASELVRVGCSPIVLERQWTVGGVWRTHGNPHSRVNSTEPAYRMRVERTSSNADHSYFHEIIDDIRRLAAQLPQEFLALGAAVHAVFRHPSIGNLCAHGFQKIDASSAAPAEFLTVASAMLLLCTNRRLGPPRRVNYQGETNFGGIIKRGLGGDIVSLPWAGAQVIIIGHGPFAIEQARTALEHHAAGVLLAVRRHGLISPAVLDYLNIVRPFTDKFEHPTSGSGLMLRLWRDAYAVVRASPPETWEHGIFRPDGHSVSVSDIYFIAHHHYLITTRRASVLCFSDKNVTLDDGTVHLAHVVLKCLGFEINEGNERLVGRACMLPNGVVEQGLWTIVEPHLDANTNLLPLVGHVSSINFTAKLVAALWNGQRYSTHGFAVLPRYTESLVVRINHVTASAANQHMLSQLASDEGLRDQLTQHVEAVAQDCHASWRPEEYLAVNREQWATLNTFLASLSRRGAKCLPYQFENALEVLKLELPHVLMEASRESMALMNDEGVQRLSTSRVNGNNPEPRQIQMQHEFETMVKAIVQDLAAGVITVDADMPLMEGALDSLAAAELSSRLQRLVGSATQVSSTVLFEYPNTRLLTRHLQSMVGAGDGLTRSALALATNVQAAAAVERALVLALSVMWGGGWNDQGHRLQVACGNTVRSVPSARWCLNEEVETLLLSKDQLSGCSHGTFVRGIDEFDQHHFFVSQAETSAMDPQQRKLLEFGYTALHRAAFRRGGLKGGTAGVFVGFEAPDWWHVKASLPIRGSFVMGDTVNVASGRLSFALDLNGAAMTIDTACSSGLCATHSAVVAMRVQESSLVLANAVSFKLRPHPAIMLISAGTVSVSIACEACRLVPTVDVLPKPLPAVSTVNLFPARPVAMSANINSDSHV